jgi:hypothetical protein
VTAGPTIPDIRAGLLAAAAPTTATARHAQAFRGWVLDDHALLDELAVKAAASLRNGAGRAAGDVATLGYIDAMERLNTVLQPALVDGLAWLADRTWFRPHQPPTLEADGLAAFGVALGLKRQGQDIRREWLQVLAVRSAATAGLVPLDRSLFWGSSQNLPERAR